MTMMLTTTKRTTISTTKCDNRTATPRWENTAWVFLFPELRRQARTDIAVTASEPCAVDPWVRPRTAYIHVPFCGHHCGYCDFAVTAGQDHLIELYLDALECELATLGKAQPVETLFIGGGTPTYLTLDQLERLLRAVQKWLPFANERDREYSIESTPESLDAEKVAILASFGVNRISIGVQPN